MPIDRTPVIPRSPNRDPRRHATDVAAVWADKPDVTPHLAGAIDDEIASIQAAGGGPRTVEEDQEFTAAIVVLIDRLPDPTVRGLINHARELTEPADLAAWRRAWPRVLAPLTDEEASAVIRFAYAAAQDQTVMPEHFGRRAVVAQMRARAGSAAGAVGASGPGRPLTFGEIEATGGVPVRAPRGQP